MENDDYSFCNELEREAVKVFNATGLRAFERVVRNAYDYAIAKVESDSQGTKPTLSYTLQNWVGVLKSIYAAKGDIEAYLALGNEGGLTPKDCEVLAEIYEKKRRPAEALEWVERGIEIAGRQASFGFSAYRLPLTRRRLLKRLGQASAALQSAWEDFRSSPSTYGYDELFKYVPRSEQIEWRQKALAEAAKGEPDDFMAICSRAKEWNRLAAFVLDASPERLEDISHYVSEPAAAGLAKSHPAAAAKLFRALGLRIVKAGKSKYYPEAIENLRNAMGSYIRAGLGADWDAVVAQLRQDHGRKHGFLSGFESMLSRKSQGAELSYLEKAKRRWS